MKVFILRNLKNLELNIMNELPFVRECARKCHLRDRGVSYQQDLYRQCSKLHQLRYEPGWLEKLKIIRELSKYEDII